MEVRHSLAVASRNFLYANPFGSLALSLGDDFTKGQGGDHFTLGHLLGFGGFGGVRGVFLLTRDVDAEGNPGRDSLNVALTREGEI